MQRKSKNVCLGKKLQQGVKSCYPWTGRTMMSFIFFVLFLVIICLAFRIRKKTNKIYIRKETISIIKFFFYHFNVFLPDSFCSSGVLCLFMLFKLFMKL